MQPHRLSALSGRQLRPITAIDAGLTDPVPQIRLADTQIPGHRRDRPVPVEDQRHRVNLELLPETAAEKLSAESSHIGGAEQPLEVVHRPATAAPKPRHSELGGRGRDALLFWMAGGAYLDSCRGASRVGAVGLRVG